MMNRPEGWILAMSVTYQPKKRSELRTYVVDGLVIKILGRDGFLDDLLQDLPPQLLGGDVLRVLGRDDDGVNTLGDDSAVIMLVLDGDLGLGVGSEPRESAITTGSSHVGVQLVGKNDGQGEELGGLISGISEHDTLVTGTKLLKSLLVVEPLGNVLGLLLNGNQDVAGLVVEALV